VAFILLVSTLLQYLFSSLNLVYTGLSSLASPHERIADTRYRRVGWVLTFKACLISKIDLAIGTVFSGLADQPAENPAWMSAFHLPSSKRQMMERCV
jgi:hypothetical protein